MAEKLADFNIEVNVDNKQLLLFGDAVHKVEKGVWSTSDAILYLKAQVEDYVEKLSRCKAGTDEYRDAAQKLKASQEELAYATSNLGKRELKQASAASRQLAKDEKAVAKEAENASKKVKLLAQNAVGFLGQYIALKKTLSAVMGFAAEGEELARMAQLSGISAESIERLGIALKNYGGSASSASSALGKLNKQMEELKVGKNNKLSQAAIQYGLNVNASSPEQMMMNIAKRMEGLKPLQQVNLGRMLGLDNSMIMLLQQGVAGVQQELAKSGKLTVFSKEDIENTQRMQRAYREFQQRFEQIKATITSSLVPVLQVVFERLAKIAEYLKEHPTLIKTIGSVATAVLTGLAMMFAPITTILAGVAGFFALLIDDWVAFKEGGESALSAVWEAIEYVCEGLGKILGFLGDIWNKFMDFIGLGNKEESQEEAINSTHISGAIDGKTSSILQDTMGVPDFMNMGAEQITSADASPLNSMTSNSIISSSNSANSQSTVWNVGSVTVNQKNNENSLQTLQDWSAIQDGAY